MQPHLADLCSKAQELAINITQDLFRFMSSLQINPAGETQRTLDDRVARIQDVRNHIDANFNQLAELCVQIHQMAPHADEECAKILKSLNTANQPNQQAKLTSFDKVLAEQREATVEHFSLKADLELANRDIGRLIDEFRNVLSVIDASEPATSLYGVEI